MPADDLVLNVRQIAGYSPVSNAPPGSSILMQIGGLGSAYNSISPAAFVGTALSEGGNMAIGGRLSALSVQGGSAQFSNGAFGILSAQTACLVNLEATFGSIGGVRIATATDLAMLAAATVSSFNGRQGAVCLWLQDIINAGGAPNFSPVFGGEPRAPTPAPTSNSSRLATTAFVASALGALTLGYAPLDSPDFVGVPTAPTPPLGSADGTLATTAFVQSAIASTVAGVASFNTRTGIVTLTNADVTGAGGAVLNSPAFTGTPTAPTPPPADVSTRIATTAFVMTESGFAPLASPTFTGIPAAPTPTPGTNTTQIATTAYVQAAITGISVGVSTFNGRSGAVTLVANDITAAGGAILASPAFTGTPTAPNPPPGDSSTRIATTAYVQSLAGFAPIASPAFTGVPTAPTAAPGNNTTQLATTAYVEAAIANSTAGVASFNGRTGAVTLQANDISAAGGAVLASPAFTGTPSAPTAAVGTSSTQLATCAYVMNAASTTAPLMDGTAGAGVGTTWSRADHVHPSDTSRATVAQLNTKLNLTGGTLTGALSGTSAQFSGLVGAAQFNAPSFAVIPTGGSSANLAFYDSSVTLRSSLVWQVSNGFLVATNAVGGASWTLDQTGNLQTNSANANKPGGGPWATSSDARIKTVVGDYAQGLDDVLALRPVTFVYKGNDTPSADVNDTLRQDVRATRAAPFPASPHYQVARDQTEFVGLIAQEVEAIFPDMVTTREGFIDGAPADIKQLNTGSLIFALLNAVKTLAARVAALEAA
jgi:hypothetical protein